MSRFKQNSDRFDDLIDEPSYGYLEISASGITSPSILEDLRNHLSNTNSFFSFIHPGEIIVYTAIRPEFSSETIYTWVRGILEEHQFIVFDSHWVR